MAAGRGERDGGDAGRSRAGAGRDPAIEQGLRAWRAMLDAHAAATRLLADEMERDHGLPLSWYDVLVQLGEADGGRLRTGELADRVVLSPSGLSRRVGRMAEAGLVARERCADDARGTWVRLTPAGRRRLRRIGPEHADAVARHVIARWDDDEAAVVEQAMRRVADALGPSGAAEPGGGEGDDAA